MTKSKVTKIEVVSETPATRKKGHTCEVCGKTFTTKAQLVIHYSAKNKCSPSATKEKVEKPVTKETKTKTPFRCWAPKCKFRTTTEKKLLAHYKADHPDVKIKKLAGGGFEPIIGDVRVTSSVDGKKPKKPKPKKKKRVKIDRGPWFNARTGMQLWLANDSEELKFLDEEVKKAGVGGRPRVLLAALQSYMKKKRKK